MTAGFRFVHLPGFDDVLAVQGWRVDHGAMDMFLVRAPLDALASRVRVEDLNFAGASPTLWEKSGAVADVVMELLGLPTHGSPGAPMLAQSRSLLWVPGDALS
ncbi:hypothetical protein [Saccharopolyspora hattusasensis]|uniref:hypothetical protein n=1 Tax=Saccharopolyspora hattusasensis TaxID=1128679 RepID=UPI003D997ACD